ncbi:MAG: MarR family transcriptional regulator [Candidatus Hodarchaeales archaeon]|jgi:DNA-binding MarR family transcriptional regulator
MAIINTSEVIETEQSSDKVTLLPKSAQEVYSLLCSNGALKPREIGMHTSLSNRTIRYALKILVDDMLVRRVPDLSDLRSHFYTVN